MRVVPQIMDPIGFALENFDLVGTWRERRRPHAGRFVGSARGRHARCTARRPAAGAAQPLRRVRDRRDRTASHLRAGPAGDTDDMPTVRAIVRRAAQNDYRFSSLVLGVVESAPFQMRIRPDRSPGR